MREAAVACFRCSALRRRACIAAILIDARLRCAELVPLRRAAEDVDQADRIAARFVVTPRSEVCFAARACAATAAFGLIALAAGGSVDALHARSVPLVLAAVRVDVANRFAAIFIAARRAVVRQIAARQADAAALGDLVFAELPCAINAVLIPTHLAAVLVLFRRADGVAAIATIASWLVVHREAVSTDREAAAANAGATRFENARRIPTDVAAVRLVTANGFAARSVIAVGRLVWHEAAARADVAAAWERAAGDACDRNAA